jgi:hypothetical protein
VVMQVFLLPIWPAMLPGHRCVRQDFSPSRLRTWESEDGLSDLAPNDGRPGRVRELGSGATGFKLRSIRAFHPNLSRKAWIRSDGRTRVKQVIAESAFTILTIDL